MKIHCLQHAAFEGAGFFEEWAKQKEFSFTMTRVFDQEKLPFTKDYDFLLVMGGPQSPRETDKYPYLEDEIKLIKQSILQNKHVIGVCLGAQLIAESYGAKTLKSPQKEVGVFDIELTVEGKKDPLFRDFPAQSKVGHWHNDMPGIPAEAVIIAKSEGCPHQIVKFASRVYGFQCHMELTKQDIDALITNCPEDLVPGKYIQGPNEMLQEDFALIHENLSSFLDKFIKV